MSVRGIQSRILGGIFIKFNTVFSTEIFRKKLLRRLALWLLISVAAAALVLSLHYFFRINYGKVSARISYNYSGIERGIDPAGNRFEVAELKQLSLVKQAAAQAGLALDDAALEELQEKILILGDVSISWIEAIINYDSIFTSEGGLTDRLSIRESSYFPTQYTVYFSYLDAGMTEEQGQRFLDALLSVYADYFSELYGYNHAIEDSVRSIDYTEYDYHYSIDVLNTSLSSLRAFLARLSAADYTRFRSQETGYSFNDLIDAVDTIRSEDIDWLTFYIDSNNVTKNREERIAYLNYRIESAQREQQREESNLKTLEEIIDSYEKTTAVILSLGMPGVGEGGLEQFQFTQQSGTYDSLVNRRVSQMTAIRETAERIALYQSRIERLEEAGFSGSAEIVEQRLAEIDQKVQEFLAITDKTASEYYRTVKLKDAFTVLESTATPVTRSISLIKNSLTDLLAVEGLIFGFYVLSAALSARITGAAPDAAKQKARSASPRQKQNA